MVSLLAWKGVLFKAKRDKPTEGTPPNNKLLGHRLNFG